MTQNDAETLNFLFPEIAFDLECEQVRAELCDRLGLQASVKVAGARGYATVTLNDGYKLLLKPAMPGFNGIRNWFKWRELTNRQTGQVIKMSQVRCSVELQLYEAETDSYVGLVSFGIDAADMEQTVSKALGKVHQHCGLRLIALPKVQVRKTTK